MDEEEQLLQEHQAMQAADDEWWATENVDLEWQEQFLKPSYERANLQHQKTSNLETHLKEIDMGIDMTKYAATESNDLKAADFKGKNIKVIIESVEIRHYEARNDQPASDKAVLRFVGKEKTLVLNKTNTKRLIDAYGPDSESWTRNEIGLSTHETELGTGWVVTPLNIQPPDFDDSIPF